MNKNHKSRVKKVVNNIKFHEQLENVKMFVVVVDFSFHCWDFASRVAGHTFSPVRHHFSWNISTFLFGIFYFDSLRLWFRKWEKPPFSLATNLRIDECCRMHNLSILHCKLAMHLMWKFSIKTSFAMPQYK